MVLIIFYLITEVKNCTIHIKKYKHSIFIKNLLKYKFIIRS